MSLKVLEVGEVIADECPAVLEDEDVDIFGFACLQGASGALSS